MKANELRIGNWIFFDDKHGFINSEKIVAINYAAWIDGIKQWWIETDNLEGELFNERFKPIPLTDEWLLKFGFTKYQWTDAYFIHTKFGDLMVRFLEGKIYTHFTNVYADQKGMMMKGRRYVGNLNSTQNITHVHTLQNLYFALIGQELTLKP